MKKVIIPVAGYGSRVIGISKDSLPKAMLPINGKPAISYIIENLQDNFLNDIIVIYGYKGDILKNYLEDNYKDINFTFVEQKELKGLAHAIYQCKEFINEDDSVLIQLGDTIVKENLIFNYDCILYDIKKDFDRWCLILNNEENEIIDFVEKPKEYLDIPKAVIGIYNFENGFEFMNSIEQIIKSNVLINNEFQISQAIKIYLEKFKVISKQIENKHFDTGSIDNYYQTRRGLISSRFFNEINIDGNVLTKTSKNTKKLIDEINWYMNLPKQLKKYTPTIYEYSLIPNPIISMEYYGYKTLQELYIYDDLNIYIWEKIFDDIFKMLNDFKIFKVNYSFKDFKYMIVDKTLERSGTFLKQNLDKIENFISKNKFEINNCVIHGDLCFNNILYDTNSGILKIIDPRGSFGNQSISGILEYDVSKLSHSLNGDYDLIKANISNRTKKQNEIIDLFNSKINKEYKEKEILLIKVIEYCLFVSMIPLHKDNSNHQKRFLERASNIWNEIGELI